MLRHGTNSIVSTFLVYVSAILNLYIEMHVPLKPIPNGF